MGIEIIFSAVYNGIITNMEVSTMKLKNKIAVITGAAAGIGRGTAIKFAMEGAKLALIDINRELLDVTAAELEKYNTEVVCYTCDISNESAVYV